jgi:(p)ppGpp synthase/HD superfamily hydrolase
VIAKHGGNIIHAEAKSHYPEKSQIKLALTISDLNQLEHIAKNITKSKWVHSVKKI